MRFQIYLEIVARSISKSPQPPNHRTADHRKSISALTNAPRKIDKLADLRNSIQELLIYKILIDR